MNKATPLQAKAEVFGSDNNVSVDRLVKKLREVFNFDMQQLSQIIAIVQDAQQKTRAGVDYSVRQGAACPVCGARHLKITKSEGWVEGFKIRYHKCQNENCLACRLNLRIKSIQEA